MREEIWLEIRKKLLELYARDENLTHLQLNLQIKPRHEWREKKTGVLDINLTYEKN